MNQLYQLIRNQFRNQLYLYFELPTTESFTWLRVPLRTNDRITSLCFNIEMHWVWKGVMPHIGITEDVLFKP